jgi:ketosteroid isomerase-like protein
VNQPDAAEGVVRGFLAAFGAFDADAAMSYVADDAELWWMIGLETSANERGLALELALLEAQRYRQTVTWCVASPWRSGTRVTCGFEFDAIASDVLGKGPFTGSTFVFTVRDGEIVEAVARPDFERFGPRVRAPFAEWVAARHPKDFPVMYGTDSIPSDPEGFLYVSGRPTEESIRLWTLRIPEYVKDVRQGTA